MDMQSNDKPVKDNIKKKMLPFYILSILEEFTDEENALLPTEIKEKINHKYGGNSVTKVETILDNIRAINEFYADQFDDTEIIQLMPKEKLPKDKKIKYIENPRYYLAQRRLDFSEVAFLNDLIRNSKTLASKEAQGTYTKLLGFLSKRQQVVLKNIALTDGGTKTPNRDVYLNLENIQQAITHKRNIEFSYCEYNLQKRLVQKKRNYKYIVSPYGTISSNGGYYLVGYHLPTKGIRVYRMDKIRNIVSSKDEPYFIDKDFDLKKYVKNSVFMYVEEDKILVRMRCGMDILDDVIERFENCRLFADKTSPDHFIAEIPDTTEKGMLYWVLQFSCSCELLEPASLREKIKGTLERALRRY